MEKGSKINSKIKLTSDILKQNNTLDYETLDKNKTKPDKCMTRK